LQRSRGSRNAGGKHELHSERLHGFTRPRWTIWSMLARRRPTHCRLICRVAPVDGAIGCRKLPAARLAVASEWAYGETYC
jgi:hypothetical protein